MSRGTLEGKTLILQGKCLGSSRRNRTLFDMDGDRSSSEQNDCHDTNGDESWKKMRHPCLGVHVYHAVGMLRWRLKVARKVRYPFHAGCRRASPNLVTRRKLLTPVTTTGFLVPSPDIRIVKLHWRAPS